MYIGIDYGRKRIGLAYSEGDLAHGIGFIFNNVQLLENMKEIYDRHPFTTAVIGIPHSPLDIEIKKFAENLKTLVNCQIEFEDEFNTTNEAHEAHIAAGVRRKKRREDNSAAAAIILQRYLDRKRFQE